MNMGPRKKIILFHSGNNNDLFKHLRRKKSFYSDHDFRISFTRYYND